MLLAKDEHDSFVDDKNYQPHKVSCMRKGPAKV